MQFERHACVMILVMILTRSAGKSMAANVPLVSDERSCDEKRRVIKGQWSVNLFRVCNSLYDDLLDNA